MKSRIFGRKAPVQSIQGDTRLLLAREVRRLLRIQKREIDAGERPDPESTEMMASLSRAVANLTDAMRKREEWDKRRDSAMSMDEKVAAVIALLNDLPPARLAEVLASVRQEALNG